MSLRYRLFLWVSGLFIVISVCSYFLENFVVQKQLNKAQQLLRQKLLGISEQRRTDLQNYLAEVIAEDEIRIDAILNNISSFSPQAMRFGPSKTNEKKGTWGDASDLLLEYKWVDFIQNTNQGKTTAGIIPQQTAMDAYYRIEIDEDLSWIYNASIANGPIAYLGVRLPYSLIAQSSLNLGSELLEHMSGVVPDVYFLFDVQKMMQAAPNEGIAIFENAVEKTLSPIQVKWTEGYELDLSPFVRAFQRGRELLLSEQIKPPDCTSDELKRGIDGAELLQDGRLGPIPTQNLLSSVSNEKLMKKRFEDIALRYTQINVIWVLIAMFDSGVFGQDLFQFPTPEAASVFGSKNAIGAGVATKDVVFANKIFNDRAYYQSNPSSDPHSNLATSLAVITSALSNRIFLGNTAEFNMKAPGEERTGYLTLGVDADYILQRLVLAVRQKAVLVHGGKALSVYLDNGEKMKREANEDLPFDQMLKKKSGIVPWEGQDYFFIHVQPFSSVDLHFFLFNPESKEFALLHDLESGSQQVVDTIRFNIHIEGLIALLIAILLLNNISRNITKPIIQLASATKDISEGRLDESRLSMPMNKHNDEIAVLCRSFEEMVKGLQEKEKVKGVLNKVVSREIAQEILKGSIHLGGEEKKVTVLFADIRDFTKMTQNMLPQKVIELLNACMTKISQIIDKNNGVIDKYVGDEAMALFGAPISRNEDAFNAIKSALEMAESIRQWNQTRISRGESAIELGIGIHTGPMLAGNMGAENRLNYTVIGSNVNLAFRVCSAAKKMEILITKDTLDEPFVKERFMCETNPPLQLKGFDKPVEVYRIIGLNK